MNENNDNIEMMVNYSALGILNEASAINKTVCALIAAKGAAQDLVIGDDEAFGMLLILEQVQMKIDKVGKILEEGVA